MRKRILLCILISFYYLVLHKDNLIQGNFEQSNIYANYVLNYFTLVQNSLKAFLNISNNNEDANANTSFPHYARRVYECGFTFEEHQVLTEDGYILSVWRIPGRINESPLTRQHRKPVILQHGLFDSAYTWLVNPKESLAILLAKNNYDVWIGNSRGNVFSTGHMNSTEYDSTKFYSKFWDYTFHEMALYDFKATVSYVKSMSMYKKLTYIGHSQGGIIYLIHYTINPKFIEENIEKFVSIGTIVNVFTTSSKIVRFLSYTNAMILAEKLNIKNIFVFNDYLVNFIGYFCKNVNSVCMKITQFFIEDYPTQRINYELLFQEFFYIPAGTSARNVNHWVQFFTKKKFAQFDFGEIENMKRYGTPQPPLYDLTKFRNYQIKSLFYASNADPFSKIEDCQHLFRYLKKDIAEIRIKDGYNHLDYLWSSDAVEDIYSGVLDFLSS